MPETRSQPASELYPTRLHSAKASVAELLKLEERISNLRLATFIFGGVVAWLIWGWGLISTWSIALPIAIFVALIVRHGRTISQRERQQRIVAFYEHGMARIEARWTDFGTTGDRFVDPGHPYTSDLDVFGHGSLFQLLCTARTAIGQTTLADWLQGPAPPHEVRARQAAVDEIMYDVDRREALALVGDEVAPDIDPTHLVKWATGPDRSTPHVLRWVCVGLVLTSALSFVAVRLGLVPIAVFLAAAALQTAFGRSQQSIVKSVQRSLGLPSAELAALARLLEQIEDSSFRSPKLVALQKSLATDGQPASSRIAKLQRLIELLDARRNQMFAAIAPLLLWGTQFSLAIEAWRQNNGPNVPQWLDAVGEYESLCALAAFTYEQTETNFPTLGDGHAHFDAKGLRHPLMAMDQCVANDVLLNTDNALLVISGSNMSGKSTLLRTIGTNAVLAQMGAPACAKTLTLSGLQIGTSMRTQDSLLDGTSRFYAEIKRLKQIVDLVDNDLPLLFLLDEVLHGTNSHDRRIGAEAIVTALVEQQAIGLITTHDLTLTQVADNLGPLARNVHFADHLVDGEMHFDYTMHDGPVQRSNALGLMRAIGLKV